MTEAELIEAAKDLQAVHGLTDEQVANVMASAMTAHHAREAGLLKRIMPAIPLVTSTPSTDNPIFEMWKAATE